ncbi:hotdog domain-containing protein [Gordonia sp. ABSL1-1]|uniref:acyl-CoA thioesterase n=1 Tax=Gordonia sp. ABSL1-1 TaxID=3053923 RepID=UPI0025742B67|nr:acyl-CoA thioesterase [Gordonia sp. ABSL1-1]MDL9938371.1 hotdog domain-containing protein [Gordonia sp. ABSL1-1]
MSPTPAREITLRFLAAPTDATTLGGDVRGGRLLSWIDKAAYACAAAWSGGYSVTAYFGNITFTRGIEPGDIVEVTATLIHTGTSSMHIQCTVRSAAPHTGVFTVASECLVIFVAMGEDTGAGRRPRPVPQWVPVTDADRAAQEYATTRIPVRKRIEEAMASVTYSDAGTAPRSQTRFLAAPTDVNWGGNAHGGRVMEWMDESAYLNAARWCGGRCVSAYVGGIRFYAPIHIGDVVELDARLIHTGKQTMHVSVHVRAGDPHTGVMRDCAHSLTIVAAVDDQGDATAVRRWAPVSAEDISLDEHARELISIRSALPRRPQLVG